MGDTAEQQDTLQSRPVGQGPAWRPEFTISLFQCMKNVIYLSYLEIKETKPQNLYLSYNVLISIGKSKITHPAISLTVKILQKNVETVER